MYYESYGCPTVPKGTEIILTAEHLNELLVYANFPNYSKTKIVNFDLVKAMVAPKYWDKGYYKKDIEFRYNGNLNAQSEIFILNAWMRYNIEFITELKRICSDLETPKKDEGYHEWKNKFYRTKINLHVSVKEGVGQGAFESGLANACLIEYPKTKHSLKVGLKDGFNCFLVNTAFEAKECYEQLKNDLELQEQFRRELLKTAYRHTYNVIKPYLKLLFNQIKSLRG